MTRFLAELAGKPSQLIDFIAALCYNLIEKKLLTQKEFDDMIKQAIRGCA